MARDYGKLSTSIWRHPAVRPLADDAKLLLVYLFGNEHSTAAGCYRLPLAYVSDDLGWTIGRVSEALAILYRKPFVCRDDTHDIIYVPGWWDENEITSPKNAIHVANVFKSLPDCWIRTAAINNLLGYPNHSKTVSDTLSDRLPKCIASPSPPPSDGDRIPVRSQEQEQETVVGRSEENSASQVELSTPAPEQKPPATETQAEPKPSAPERLALVSIHGGEDFPELPASLDARRRARTA